MGDPDSRISWRGQGVSTVWLYMKRFFPPAFAVTVLALIGSQLQAISAMRESLDTLLDLGVVQSAPQNVYSEWADKSGIVHRIETPRERSESDSVLAARHAEAVAAFSETFPPRK